MKHYISALDLLLYLYGEVSYLEKMAIEQELARNEALRTELEQIRKEQTLLGEQPVLLEPPVSVLDSVLAYSRRPAGNTIAPEPVR